MRFDRMLLAAAGSAIPIAISPTFQKNQLEEKIRKAENEVSKTMIIQGIPGLSIGVSVRGKTVWKTGFGYSNVESSAICTGDTVMRIASISKPITSTIAARLVESKNLDLDEDVRKYVPDFPIKSWQSNNTKITTRQLLSHSAGIRHYLNENKKSDILEDPANSNARSNEFLLNKKFKDVTESLELFKNDDLVAEPGQKFSYTTFGFTLVSAVLEKASGMEYRTLANNLFRQLGMRNTQLDVNERIVNYRASYYRRNSRHNLENCPVVDCSYKYAGGGIISNVNDLLIFANAILKSKLSDSKDTLLSKSAISNFLTPQISVDATTDAALGWFVVEGPSPHFYHTGGAVGASSVLLVQPASGICVVILCNLQETSVLSLARNIAAIFSETI